MKLNVKNLISKHIPKETMQFINQKPVTKFIKGNLYNSSFSKSNCITNSNTNDNYTINNSCTNFSDSLSISLMTWNILASGYTSPTVYYYVSPEYLDENHRMNIIYYDLLNNFSDIVCLQEVEKRNYEKFLKISEDFYNGVYEKRTGLTCDGLALFYKKEKFNQVFYELIKLNNISSNANKILRSNNNSLPLLKKMTMTHNIAQLIVLEPVCKILKEKIDYFLVVNLHLHWDPNKELIKLIQIYDILNKAKEVYQNFTKEKKKMSVFICGDFNSMPDSNVVSIIQNKDANKIEAGLVPLYFQMKNEFNEDQNKIVLHNAHENYNFFTNIKPDFKGKLDYIFYSNEEFYKKSVISYFDTNKFTIENALPNSFHGSDHLYLISKFYL